MMRFVFFIQIRVTTFLSTTQLAKKSVDRCGQVTHIGRK